MMFNKVKVSQKNKLKKAKKVSLIIEGNRMQIELMTTYRCFGVINRNSLSLIIGEPTSLVLEIKILYETGHQNTLFLPHGLTRHSRFTA